MIANLEALVALAEHGTMGRAATRLRVSQSAVSKRIAALEVELGFAVREKSGRRVRLTPAADRLLERVRPLLVELRAALAGERSGAGGELVLGVSDSILASWGPRVFAKLARRAPDLRLRLNAHRSPVAVDLVRSGEYALALVAGAPETAGGLVAETLGAETMAIVPSGLRPLRLRSGARVSLLSIERGSSTFRALRPELARLARDTGIALEIDETIQSYAAVVQLARAGLGHGLVPRPLALALGVPKRALVSIPAPGLTRPIQLVARRAALAREPAASFVAALREALTELAL